MDPQRLFCLAAVVALSLVLPLYAGTGLGRGGFDRRSALRWVWACQIAGALSGLMIIATPVPPVVGLAVAFVACAVCLVSLRRCRFA